METLRRAQHWTDDRIGKQVRRRISNWSNWKRRDGLWLPTEDKEPSVATSVPDAWGGNFDFRYAKIDGPAQAFAGDTVNVDNTTLVGLRRSDVPKHWINFRALGVVKQTPFEKLQGEPVLRWRNLWKNSTLLWRFGRSHLEKRIRLSAPGHPTQFRFAFHIPLRLDYKITNGVLSVFTKADGTEVFTSRPVWAQDANEKFIRATLVEGNPTPKGVPTLIVALNPDDLAAVAYPVVLDPTITISGAPDVEDTFLWATYPANNLGGWNLIRVGTPTTYTGMVRLLASAIPSGPISLLRIWMIAVTNTGGQQYTRMASANSWTEFGATWNTIDGVTSWAGSAGCNTSGVDYDAAPVNTTFIGTLGNWMTLVAGWAEDWRDGVYNSNGIRMSKSYTTTDISSTQNASASRHPVWEITHAGGSKFPVHFFMRR